MLRDIQILIKELKCPASVQQAPKRGAMVFDLLHQRQICIEPLKCRVCGHRDQARGSMWLAVQEHYGENGCVDRAPDFRKRVAAHLKAELA